MTTDSPLRTRLRAALLEARKARDAGTQTSANLHGPSTVARAGKFYLVVNADFANAVSPPFTVAGLVRPGHHGHGHHGHH